MTEKLPILVVLGMDADGKPHASRFSEADAALVQRAAELMSFHVVRVSPAKKDAHAVAVELPLGKIFATGRAFVPFVARSAFDKLAALVEAGFEPRSAAAAPPVDASAGMVSAEAVNNADALWSTIEIGSVVLAQQPEVWGPGWWESVVVTIDGDDLTLRWLDDEEDEPEPFHAARRSVGLRHPGAA